MPAIKVCIFLTLNYKRGFDEASFYVFYPGLTIFSGKRNVLPRVPNLTIMDSVKEENREKEFYES